MDKLKFCMLKEDAMMPEKRAEDAGYDIYPCFSELWYTLPAHETVMVPTGIASVFDSKYVAVLKERGSTGSKGLGQRCGVIDSGYRGEWMVPITNHNDYDMYIIKEDYKDEFMEDVGEGWVDMDEDDIIYPYEKAICQMILLPVPEVEVEKITQEELEAATSERMDGKLGSSGK